MGYKFFVKFIIPYLVYEFFLSDQWQGPLSSLYHGITVLGLDSDSVGGNLPVLKWRK